MPQTIIRLWRIINTIVFVTGLISPWVRFNLDAQSIPYQATPGWEIFLATWLEVWDDLIVNEFDPRMWPFWLFGFGSLLLILYLLLNLYLIAKDINRKGNKLFSLILLGIAGTLLPDALIGDRPELGYWLINLGLLSSAALEWMAASPTLQKE